MGCDGGTIPKRKEIVKSKGKRPRKERATGADEAERWKNCVICDWKLEKPIVAGHWGHLFDKECVLEFLIENRRGTAGAAQLQGDKSPALDSMHKMKDFKELKFKEKPGCSESQASDSQQEGIKADFVCPITDLETNGQYKFVFSWNCGCVVSERAYKTVKDDKCLVCQAPYKPYDIVILNPDEKDLEGNQAKFLVRELAKSLNNEQSPEVKLVKPNPMRGSRIPQTSWSEIRAERKAREALLWGNQADSDGDLPGNPKPSTSKEVAGPSTSGHDKTNRRARNDDNLVSSTSSRLNKRSKP